MLYNVFSNIIVSHPTHIAHKVFGFLQYWYQLSSKEERVKRGDTLEQAPQWTTKAVNDAVPTI